MSRREAGTVKVQRYYAIISGDQPVDTFFSLESLERAVPGFLRNRAPFYVAIERLQQEEKRTLVSIRGVGYKIAAAEIHVTVAKKREKRAERQIAKAKSVNINVRLDELSAEQVRLRDSMDVRFATLLDAHYRQERRLNRMEKLVQTDHRRQSQTAAEMSEQLDRMKNFLVRMGFQDEGEPEATAAPEPDNA